jgi:hypothetical protein
MTISPAKETSAMKHVAVYAKPDPGRACHTVLKAAMKTAERVAKKICYAVVGLSCLFYAGWALAEPNIQEGLWEITIKMAMAGKPDNAIPPTTQTQCLTDKSKLPQLLQQDQTCQITDTKTVGNEASWKMKCQSQGSLISGTGKITYKGDRFDGVIQIRMQPAGAEPMKVTQHIQGRFMGGCP